MIYVGIDDTDMPDAPGTNQLAKALVADLADCYSCSMIVRHQLFQDPRVPYTSKNSSASLSLSVSGRFAADQLMERLRGFLLQRFVDGSDPGACIATRVPGSIVEFATRCQHQLVTQEEARRLAREHDIRLEGFGGTEDGVIGALAAVGLRAEGNDGRIVQLGQWPDDLSGRQPIEAVRRRGVAVVCEEGGAAIRRGTIDVGKHLRPNYRQQRPVVFARRVPSESNESVLWRAVRFT